MSVFKTFVILALSLLFKRGVRVSLELSGLKLAGVFGLEAIPPFLPVFVEYSLSYRIGKGFELILDGGRPRSLKRNKKRKRSLGFFKALNVREAKAEGRVGISERPDLSAISAGALQILLSDAAAALTGSRPEVSIVPDLSGSAFDLYVEGIVYISAGRIIKEVILSRRRTK